MITLQQLETLYAKGDALVEAGDTAGAERIHFEAMRMAERAACEPIEDTEAAVQALTLAAHLAVGEELAAGLHAALKLEEALIRLIALRRALALSCIAADGGLDRDAIPRELIGRAVLALARPTLVDA